MLGCLKKALVFMVVCVWNCGSDPPHTNYYKPQCFLRSIVCRAAEYFCVNIVYLPTLFKYF